jgi:TonB family protein
MKNLNALLSTAALWVATVACAQPVSSGGGVEPLRIRAQRDWPIFPHEMIQLGVRDGMARVAFSVNAEGKVDDCLAVAYSHPEFAEATIVALKHWTFDPARYRGEPVAASSEITVNFEVHGTVVVSMTPADTMAAMMNALMRDGASYRPRLLSELDRIPTPVHVVTPQYSETLAKQGRHGSVRVQFYIDEKGAVRLPSVSASEDAELAALAVAAVQQWKFEPPRCKGIPVLVRAEQIFNFKPESATAKVKAS